MAIVMASAPANPPPGRLSNGTASSVQTDRESLLAFQWLITARQTDTATHKIGLDLLFIWHRIHKLVISCILVILLLPKPTSSSLFYRQQWKDIKWDRMMGPIVRRSCRNNIWKCSSVTAVETAIE